jgi:hypothetical protein
VTAVWREDGPVEDDGDVPVLSVALRRGRAEALLGVLAVVLEAKLAAELGDVGRSDRAVEVAAERLLELLP